MLNVLVKKYSSIFSTAVIGIPAVTLQLQEHKLFPHTASLVCSLTISMALGFVGSRLIYPFSSSLDK